MTDTATNVMGKGQANRLSQQHVEGGGVVGIFGADAQIHDADIRKVADAVYTALNKNFPHLKFRIRSSVTKQEIHNKLASINQILGAQLFVSGASIKPDGRVTEVKDKYGNWRVILVGESKHQGNDIAKITAGERTAAMAEKGQYIMPAGNAIERVHKNIQELKNYMIDERHFPYVVFLQGSNFATEQNQVTWPGGPQITISPNNASLNRIDRVTACNYGMEINRNYCRNIVVDLPVGQRMLQAASIYAQCDLFSSAQMFDALSSVALTSLEVLAEDLPSS